MLQSVIEPFQFNRDLVSAAHQARIGRRNFPVLTQTQRCEPVIVNPNGMLTINYLDTCEAPLSPMHLAFSAGLCMQFCGNEALDGERKAIRHALIVANLQQLYTDVFNDWDCRERTSC